MRRQRWQLPLNTSRVVTWGIKREWLCCSGHLDDAEIDLQLRMRNDLSIINKRPLEIRVRMLSTFAVLSTFIRLYTHEYADVHGYWRNIKLMNLIVLSFKASPSEKWIKIFCPQKPFNSNNVSDIGILITGSGYLSMTTFQHYVRLRTLWVTG